MSRTVPSKPSSYRSNPPPEFYPRSHQSCSHVITDKGPQCGLALLNQVPTSNTTGRNGSSSSESSSSLHTQPAIGTFGHGNGWIQSPNSIWGRPDQTPEFYPGSSGYSAKSRTSTLEDEYHLLSMADDLVDPTEDILFNPSIHSPPFKKNINPSTLTSDQISALAAAFATPTRSPQTSNLINQATRLAKGLAHPPANRGFRAKASDLGDRDEGNTTVFVGGLSQGVTESLLNDLFEPYGSIAYVSPFSSSASSPIHRPISFATSRYMPFHRVSADYQVKIPPGKGCGFVQFHNKKEAEYAIKQMQGFECLGCSLRTHWGRSQGESCLPAPAP
jgi:hypothetical protein